MHPSGTFQPPPRALRALLMGTSYPSLFIPISKE
jgi:hypothetical protein